METERIALSQRGGMWGSPAYWNGNVYFGAAVDPGYRTCDAACLSGSDPVRAFALDTASNRNAFDIANLDNK